MRQSKKLNESRKSSIFAALLLTFPILVLGFQNCGRFGMSSGESTLGLYSLGDGFIYSPYREKMLGADLPTVLRVVPQNPDQAIDSVNWRHTFSNDAVTCEQIEGEESMFWVEITCPASGTLNVEVDVVYASGELETSLVTLVLQEDPISRINPGEDLYQAFCASCHAQGGSIASWPIANSSVAGIKNAIQTFVAMDYLADELDDDDLRDISNYLNR